MKVMKIKKSKIQHIINEVLKKAPDNYTLPDGREVKFASEDHINHVRLTLDSLIRMRNESPRAPRGGHSAASRKVYGDAARQRRKELNDILKLAELLNNEPEVDTEVFEDSISERRDIHDMTFKSRPLRIMRDIGIKLGKLGLRRTYGDVYSASRTIQDFVLNNMEEL
tara:strand:+ start:20057 stop:20560 length:504 start_codon:yes stop_codon:yes gene_type:complete